MKYCSHCGTDLKMLKEHRQIECENRENIRLILKRENEFRDVLSEFAAIREKFYQLHRSHELLQQRMTMLEPNIPMDTQ